MAHGAGCRAQGFGCRAHGRQGTADVFSDACTHASSALEHRLANKMPPLLLILSSHCMACSNCASKQCNCKTGGGAGTRCIAWTYRRFSKPTASMMTKAPAEAVPSQARWTGVIHLGAPGRCGRRGGIQGAADAWRRACSSIIVARAREFPRGNCTQCWACAPHRRN